MTIQDTIRNKIQSIDQLNKDGKIDWFYFLIHPKNDDQLNMYFDIVFTANSADPGEFLPEGCTKPEKIDPKTMTSISGIDLALLKGEDIGEAWQEIPASQIVQFMHFFMNALGLGFKSMFVPMGSFYGAQSF